MCDKNRDSERVGRELHFFFFVNSPFYLYIFMAQDAYKYTRVNLYIILLVYTYAFHFLFCVLNSVCCMQTILLKLPARNKRLSRPTLNYHLRRR